MVITLLYALTRQRAPALLLSITTKVGKNALFAARTAVAPFSYDIFTGGYRCLLDRIVCGFTIYLACGAMRRRKKKPGWGATYVASNSTHSLLTIAFPACGAMRRRKKKSGWGATSVANSTHYSTTHYSLLK